MRLPAIALTCGIVGAALMLIFEDPLTRIVGVLALLAFVVCGVFAIAGPELIEAGEEER